jgi:membrane fusion protein (multidrug efflux system)
MYYKNKLILLLIPCLVLYLQACDKGARQNQIQGPVPVNAYTVQSQRVHFYDEYPGTVTALNQVELHSQVSGFITGIFFTEGSQVAKGEKLYEIDRTKYQAAFEQAKASVDIAKSNVSKAQRDFDRYEKLNEQNAIAKQTFDDATTNLQNAKQQLVSAQAALSNAETDYNYSIITAPFSGTIGLSQVKTGTFVNAGQTLLNTLSSDDPIGVDFIINEKSLPAFINLKKDGSRATDSTFRITLPDNTGYASYGQLSVIDRAVDAQTGTIRVRLVFPNPGHTLRTGMNCNVEVLSGNTDKQIVIPYKAVIEQMGEYFVYAIDSMKVVQRKIDPGANLGEYIVVKQGLNPGDRIVLDGLQKVHDGVMVSTDSVPAKQDMVKQ